MRIPLLLLVIALIVPLGSIASGRDASAGRQRRVQVRRSVQQRLTDVGASGEVADVVVRTSKPYAYVSFALGLVAAIPAVLVYTHFSRVLAGLRGLLGDLSAAVQQLVRQVELVLEELPGALLV